MKKDKKIKNIIVSTHDSLCPIKGGGALRTLKVAEELKKRGHNVIIIAPTDGMGEINGIKVHWLHAPKKQYSQILSSLKFNIRLLRKFFQFIGNTDIFFIHNTISAAAMPFLKKVFPFIFVLDITDIHAEYLLIGKRNIFEKILTPYLLSYEYYIIKSADFISVASKAMKELLVHKGVVRDKIEVVYDGADINKFSTEKESGAELGIIHFGAVDRQHGVELIIQAAPAIIKEIPGVKFFFIGGGRELTNIKKLAKDLKVFEHCIFTDYLACGESRDCLKKASIGLIPRRDNLPNRIITTLKIYEYWASATAVIASRLEGIEEVGAGDRDIIFFNSGDWKDLTDKIIFLLRNKQTLDYLINNGLEKVKRFNWDASVSRIVNIIESSDRR